MYVCGRQAKRNWTIDGNQPDRRIQIYPYDIKKRIILPTTVTDFGVGMSETVRSVIDVSGFFHLTLVIGLAFNN